MKKLISAIFVCTLVFQCSKENSTTPNAMTPEDLLIKAGEISGWQKGNNHWIANSSGDLNTYIDGAEPVYTRHGFVEAAAQEYEGTVLDETPVVELRIFDQGKSDNAKALYEEMALLLSNPIDLENGIGEEGKIERFAISQRIIFYEKKYFISLTIDSGLDESLNVLKTFARNVSSKI
jgi:hypothetical protein